MAAWNQLTGYADGAEAADHHRRAVLDVGRRGPSALSIIRILRVPASGRIYASLRFVIGASILRALCAPTSLLTLGPLPTQGKLAEKVISEKARSVVPGFARRAIVADGIRIEPDYRGLGPHPLFLRHTAQPRVIWARRLLRSPINSRSGSVICGDVVEATNPNHEEDGLRPSVHEERTRSLETLRCEPGPRS